MSHVNEKLAEFFYGELSAAEMAESRSHLVACHSCQAQLEEFERTHHALKALPDAEPPRQIVFGFEKPRSFAPGWLVRWLAPMAASAAVSLAVVMLAPMQMQQLVVPAQIAVQQPVAQVPLAQPIDYDRIIREIRESERKWVVGEFNRRDVSTGKELQRVKAELAYYDDFQRALQKDTFENATSIQLLAQRAETRD